MSYQVKLERIERVLINTVKNEISNRYGCCENIFWYWSYTAVKEAYVSAFKNEFPEYINESIKDKLWFAGQNFGFAIQTFISINPQFTLDDLLNFAEGFVSIQIGDFNNWCDDILMAIPDEDDESSDSDG